MSDIYEAHLHSCGHTVEYATPAGLPTRPVNAEEPCWGRNAGRFPDPFAEDPKVAEAGLYGESAEDLFRQEVEAEWMADLYGWPRHLPANVHNSAWDPHLGIPGPTPRVYEEREGPLPSIWAMSEGTE